MTIFHYKAIKPSGEVFEGDVEAKDKSDVFNIINTGGISLVLAEEAEKNKKILTKINEFLSTVKTQEKIIFARNLGAMIKAGLSGARAISVMERQTKNKFFKEILFEAGEQIKKGRPLSEALKLHPKIWSNLFAAMVKAGEESGDLAGSLSEIANQMEKANTLRKKIIGAMIYPLIIFFVMIMIGVLMLIYVVPTLTATFKELDVELPITTRSIIFTSDFMKGNSFVFILILLAIFLAGYYFYRSKRGKRYLDFISTRIPLIGNLVKENNSAKTTRTLSSLLLSGVEVVSAITITKDVIGNGYYKEVLDEAISGIQKGTQVSEIFEKHENLYPVFVAEMIAVGEETGKLSEMLVRVAEYYESEIEQQTKNLSTIIEPLLMVVIGVAVGFFAVSMIMPMYSLVNGL
ncbi:MAG: type II secretion system F family protein [Patescibacteria group bacterium]